MLHRTASFVQTIRGLGGRVDGRRSLCLRTRNRSRYRNRTSYRTRYRNRTHCAEKYCVSEPIRMGNRPPKIYDTDEYNHMIY